MCLFSILADRKVIRSYMPLELPTPRIIVVHQNREIGIVPARASMKGISRSTEELDGEGQAQVLDFWGK